MTPTSLRQRARHALSLCAPHRAGRAGMTLIEVMISIALLAMIMVAAWGAYQSATRSQSKVQSINDRIHAASQAMHRVTRDLSMAFILPHEQDLDQFEVRYRTGFYGEDDRIDFTSLSHTRMFRNDKVGDQSEYSYYVKNVTTFDGESVPALVRREDAPIDDDPRTGGTVMVLLEDIERFEIEYWDDQRALTAAGGDAWVDTWDSESTDTFNRLPSRVRVTIEIPPPSGFGENKVFTSQAEIRLTAPLSF